MSAIKELIELDGRTLEGGGQLLRNAVALSALTLTPVRMANVRQNRDQPGLKAQHAAGLALVSQISRAHAQGIEKGSQCVLFDPTIDDGGIRAGEYEADPGTAGSTTLLLQVALPCLMFPERVPADSVEEPNDGKEDGREDVDTQPVISTLSLRGGTNAIQAPQADYALHVLIPFLQTHILPPSLASELNLYIKQRGFYPHGGGLLLASIPALRRGQSLQNVNLTDRGKVMRVWGTVVVSGVIGRRVGREMRDGALLELLSLSEELRSLPRSYIQVSIEENPQGRAGSSIFLLARTSTGCTFASSALGRKRVRGEETGKEAARELVGWLEEGGCVDGWMQDQVIVFLALAKGRSMIRVGRVSLHTRTAIWVAERLTGVKFEVKENVDGTPSQSLIICEGIGLEGRL